MPLNVILPHTPVFVNSAILNAPPEFPNSIYILVRTLYNKI